MPGQGKPPRISLPGDVEVSQAPKMPTRVPNRSSQRSFTVAGTELLNPTDVEPDPVSPSIKLPQKTTDVFSSTAKGNPSHQLAETSAFSESRREPQSTELPQSKSTDQSQTVVPPPGGFICEFHKGIQCQTGQTRLDQARKAVSNHFGRNKRETRLIPRWALICRKHYQRGSYHSSEWQKRKLELIDRQLDLIEEDLPGSCYVICFKSSDQARLTEYNELLASDPHSDHIDKVTTGPRDTPILVLNQLSQDYMVGNRPRSIQECKQALRDIDAMLESGDIREVPSVQFIPHIEVDASRRPNRCRPAVRSSSTTVHALQKLESHTSQET